MLPVLGLGQQALTGVFPKSVDQRITSGPLDLVWCPDSGLLQLGHSYDPTEMYGENYGYRSGLNQSMITHLAEKVKWLEEFVGTRSGDVVLDIGSNDATLLKAYSDPSIARIGIDPTGQKFKEFYPNSIRLVPEFFSADAYRAVEKRPARIVTSVAMFYDLEDPVRFAREVESILADDGVWHTEQSYLPKMLEMTAYDTVCHEHLEYYSLAVMHRILRQASLKIVNIQFNNTNGGSFAVTAAKTSSPIPEASLQVELLLEKERLLGLDTFTPYAEFSTRVYQHRDELVSLVRSLRAEGKRVFGYGASTKGNVALQFCGFTPNDIEAIADVNTDKFGSFTPSTNIPIISEADAHRMQPDYFLVLPWHFRDSILRREREYVNSGGGLIFPFPELEIVKAT